MKRVGYLYEKIYDMDNLRLAHKNAKRGKGWYAEVQRVEKHLDEHLLHLQNMLIHHTYKTSEYETFVRNESGKERLIYKLPYFPDRICQWAVLQVIEPYLIRNLTRDTYSAIPERGIHACLYRLDEAINNDLEGTRYCLKIDAKKYYPSINHNVLKAKFRKRFKDPELLWLLDEIIDSTEGDTGIPIGNYLSQYSGNFYLSDFDHWVKEEQHVRYYYRYMDDIVILSASKKRLHELRKEIDTYFRKELRLTVKGNWQVFPSYVRGIDFVGYRVFPGYRLLRKSTCTSMKRKLRAIYKKKQGGQMITYSDFCTVNSYFGWIKHCDSYRLQKRYFAPIDDAIKHYYNSKLKGGKYHDKSWAS